MTYVPATSRRITIVDREVAQAPRILLRQPGTDTRADLNSDGQFNAVDIQLVINGALGLDVTTPTDVNGDGNTDAVDVQLVINAALGLA